MELTLPNLASPLKLWEKLEIIVGEADQAGYYAARIEDFTALGIVISSPEFMRGRTLLRENCDVLVVFTREDAAYQCRSRIRKYPDGGKNFYLLTHPDHIRRVQRRQYVRVEMLTPIKYARIGPVLAWEDYTERLEWTESTTLNMSGGGVLIKLDGELEPLDLVFVRIDLFSRIGLPDTVAGIVRRVCFVEKQRVAGIEFIVSHYLDEHFGLSDLHRLPVSVRRFDHRAQNRLITFIFKQEIELRKKGLL